jgi:flagellar biosynthesis/type III secretory pathway M-ring protein FliF/YscJ
MVKGESKDTPACHTEQHQIVYAVLGVIIFLLLSTLIALILRKRCKKHSQDERNESDSESKPLTTPTQEQQGQDTGMTDTSTASTIDSGAGSLESVVTVQNVVQEMVNRVATDTYGVIPNSSV